MGIVPPLVIEVMSIARLGGPQNTKKQKFTAQKYTTEEKYG